MRTLYEQLKRARLLRGLTQHEVAGRAGISVGTYHRIESGKVTGRLKTLHAIAGALDVDFLDIVELDEVA